MEYKSWEEFFKWEGTNKVAHMDYNSNVTVEEMYQHFKTRLLEHDVMMWRRKIIEVPFDKDVIKGEDEQGGDNGK